jgi:putative membrane protein
MLWLALDDRPSPAYLEAGANATRRDCLWPIDGNYQAAQGGTPMVSAGQSAGGGYALARATGNGFGDLYLDGNPNPALQNAFLADMSGGSNDFRAIESLLASDQFYYGLTSGATVQGSDVSFLENLTSAEQRDALLGLMASQLSTNPAIAQFGASLAREEAKAIIHAAPVLKEEGRQLGQLSQQDAQTLDNMGALTGAQFDEQFLSFIVQQVQQDITQLQQEIASGTDPAARAMAAQLLSTLQQRLTGAQQLETNGTSGGSASNASSSNQSASPAASSSAQNQATDEAFLDYALAGDEREAILGLLAQQLAETPSVAACGQTLSTDESAELARSQSRRQCARIIAVAGPEASRAADIARNACPHVNNSTVESGLGF